MNDIQMARAWLEKDIRNIKLYEGFGDSRSHFSKLFVVKTMLQADENDFWFSDGPIPILFIRIFLSSTARSGNLNNLKGGPHLYIVARLSVNFLIYSAADNFFMFYPL